MGMGSVPAVKKSLDPTLYKTSSKPNEFFYCLAPKFEEEKHFHSYRVSPLNTEGQMVVRVSAHITAIISVDKSNVEARIAKMVYPSWPKTVTEIIQSCL